MAVDLNRARIARAMVRVAAAASCDDEAPVALDGSLESLAELDRYEATYGASQSLLTAYREEIASGASLSRAWTLRAWFPDGTDDVWPGVLSVFPELADAPVEGSWAIVDQDELRADASDDGETLDVKMLFASPEAAHARFTAAAVEVIARGAETVAIFDADHPASMRYLSDGFDDGMSALIFVVDAGVRVRATFDGREVEGAFGFVADAVRQLEVAGLDTEWPHEAEDADEDTEALSMAWADVVEWLAGEVGLEIEGPGVESQDAVLDALGLDRMSDARREALTTLLAAALRLRLDDHDLDPDDAEAIARARIFEGARLADAFAT